MPPTAIILRKKKPGKWSEYDHLLAEAFEILESEKCPRCGLARYVCHNESDEIRFRVEEDTCFALAAVEKRREQDKDKKLDDGVQLIPVPYSVENRDLLDYRTPFYEDMVAKYKTIEALRS